MNLTESIKQKALEIGFDLVGITDAAAIEPSHQKKINDWLLAGYAADMGYMHRNLEKRIDPAKQVEDAKSVICLGLNYNPAKSKKMGEVPTSGGRVANYALYEDYHDLMKKLMRRLTDQIASVAGGDHEFKICVDSVPLAERALAQRAGLGFIGKNHMLINPDLGGQIFLGEIITSLKLDADKPINKACDGCDKCIKACPTGALSSKGDFDAARCISYLTIESKKEIPKQLSSKIGNHLFGCDDCMLACPYQTKAVPCKNKEMKFYPEISNLDLEMILKMDETEFKERFYHTNLYRTGLEKIKSTAMICLENSQFKAAAM